MFLHVSQLGCATGLVAGKNLPCNTYIYIYTYYIDYDYMYTCARVSTTGENRYCDGKLQIEALR